MELLFLGTSSGTPTKTRNVSGVAVRMAAAKSWCLVDCGEGTQHQILHTNLSLNNLSAIFITHVHGDHCYGLPGLLDSASMSGRTEPLLIVGPEPIRRLLESVRAVSESFQPYPIHFRAVEPGGHDVDTGDFLVSGIALSHRVPSYAYAFREKNVERKIDAQKLKALGVPPGPLWKQLQGGADVVLQDGTRLASEDCLLPARRARTIVIGGDNDNPALLHAACADADVLVHESTYTMEAAQKIGPGPQHCAAQTIAQFARDAALGNLVLTHFSARYQDDVSRSPSIRDIEDEARQFYDGRLFLARDFDLFHLNRDGVLALASAAAP
jgi:ribonuclease Z